MNKEFYMAKALELAQKAAAADEVPIGAVVVNPETGAIIAEAYNLSEHSADATAHAEILAMRAAGIARGNYRLEECVLVVTLEPCLMCTGAIVHARLAGVAYGAADDRAGAVESCFNGLDLPFHNHRVWHMGGIAARECAALLQNFFLKNR